jgi:predicted dehydrogenase
VTEVRAAVFGNGFARTVVLPCLRHVPGIRVVGIASPNVERVRATAAEFGIEAVSDDHRVILDRCRPDLVYVVTPPHRHREQAIDALEAGCHVVCEKPTALDVSESASMLATARAHPKQIALIDHELRFSPARAALREMVRGGRLGTIHHASFTLLSPGRRDPATPWTWWSDRACGGGAWGAIGSHAVDSLRVLLGEVVETRGVLETFVRERPDPATGRPRPVTTDDFAAAWLRFSSGAIATITISLVEGERVHRLTLAGTDGYARTEEQQPLRVQFGRDPLIELPAEDDLPPSAELGIPDTDWARSFLRLARHTVAAIGDGRAEVPGAATFEDGHRNQIVLDAARGSDVARSTS